MTLFEVKDFISERVGKSVIVKQKISHRTIPVKYEGTITAVYDNLFIIELLNTRLKNKAMTFNYRDILTKAIEISDN